MPLIFHKSETKAWKVLDNKTVVSPVFCPATSLFFLLGLWGFGVLGFWGFFLVCVVRKDIIVPCIAERSDQIGPEAGVGFEWTRGTLWQGGYGLVERVVSTSEVVDKDKEETEVADIEARRELERIFAIIRGGLKIQRRAQ